MILKRRIPLSQKVTEIALNEACRGWQPPSTGALLCPFCQSDRVNQRMQRKNGLSHICKECDKSFSLEMIQKCQCTRPGLLAKCSACPHYQSVSKLMKVNVEQLRDLSEAEVDRIMAHPNFGHEHFSLQQLLPHLKLRHYGERWTIDSSNTKNAAESPVPITNMNAREVEQLSLFD